MTSPTTPLLLCGHYANAISEGAPACAICGTTELDPAPPPPRTEWTCLSCKRVSAEPNAFPNITDGTHYDGCAGWN